jgi:ATP-dependent RNA helicase RhlE
MPFKAMGLSDPLVQAVLAAGYAIPTEIQKQAIPIAMSGRDIIGCAQTGTGKTAAFVLPILNRLSHDKAAAKRVIRCLILTPTRELAAQIEQAIRQLGQFIHLRTLSVYGGVSINNQLNSLHHGVDIVVATPGRLMDHMQRGSVNLKHVEVLVIDEADRMFDMGFINDVRKIISILPTNRQTMLFSATMPAEVRALASSTQKAPKTIQVGHQENPAETVTQHVYPVEKPRKVDLLLHLIRSQQMYSVLVFSRTKHGADKISRRLDHSDVSSVALHSGRTQGQRQRALEGFKQGKYQVMVATDIAARGIDVEGISHVINFDVPAIPEDYIHRIGRTGRANATGDAITFVSRDERSLMRDIEKFIGRTFQPKTCEDFDYTVQPEAPKSPAPSGKHTFKPKAARTGHSPKASQGGHSHKTSQVGHSPRTLHGSSPWRPRPRRHGRGQGGKH